MRVICRLKSEEIEASFQPWIGALIKDTDCDVIAIDGKTADAHLPPKGAKMPYI
ncbi:hypothetical protein [Shewanella sp. VB17]|uniref:hypothetical protein n=1 Tax=Shewanella sp. VB17 TaxID=2739432 RepID=UPI0035C8F9F7